MLTKKLKEIKDHLQSLSAQTRSKDQERLLHELNYLDQSGNVQSELKKYRYEETVFESFVVAATNCPTCGKKY